MFFPLLSARITEIIIFNYFNDLFDKQQTPTTIKPDGNNADSALPSLTLLAMIVGVASLYHI